MNQAKTLLAQMQRVRRMVFLQRRGSQELKELTPREFEAFLVLGGSGPCSVGELSEYLMLDSGRIGWLLDRLEDTYLARRCCAEGPSAAAELTRHGRELYEGFANAYPQRIVRAVQADPSTDDTSRLRIIK